MDLRLINQMILDDASDDTESNNNLGNDYISCRDEQGKPVDWWILYKLPV